MSFLLFRSYPPCLVLEIDRKSISTLAIEVAIRAAQLGDSDQLVELLEAGDDEALRNPKLRAFLAELARKKIKRPPGAPAKNYQKEQLVAAAVEAGMANEDRHRDAALRKRLMQKWAEHYGTSEGNVEEYIKRRSTRKARH
jgi:hypothetical protein